MKQNKTHTVFEKIMAENSPNLAKKKKKKERKKTHKCTDSGSSTNAKPYKFFKIYAQKHPNQAKLQKNKREEVFGKKPPESSLSEHTRYRGSSPESEGFLSAFQFGHLMGVIS